MYTLDTARWSPLHQTVFFFLLGTSFFSFSYLFFFEMMGGLCFFVNTRFGWVKKDHRNTKSKWLVLLSLSLSLPIVFVFILRKMCL